MDFWIFMLISNLLIPFSMIFFGIVFVKKPPKQINFWYGYRTTMSTKNTETWMFAHWYFGRIWRMEGWILLPLAIIAMLFVLGKDTDTVGFYGGGVAMVECVLMLIPIIFTEVALHKRFDSNGNRK